MFAWEERQTQLCGTGNLAFKLKKVLKQGTSLGGEADSFQEREE